MPRYCSKPSECEAMQWTVDVTGEVPVIGSQVQAEQIVAWVNAHGGEARYEQCPHNHTEPCRIDGFPHIAVRTINGWAYAAPGHYVVMGGAEFFSEPVELGVDGPYDKLRDFYPCDPETFERRWELHA